MCNTRYGRALFYTVGTHQCTGCNIKHIMQFSLSESPHDMSADYGRAASASGTSAMHILRTATIQHKTAIVINFLDIISGRFHKFYRNGMPFKAEISRQNQVKSIRRISGVFKIFCQRINSSRRHSRTHIARILDALVDNSPRQDLRNIRSWSIFGNNKSAGSGRRPLRGRCTLPAVFERKSELSFCRTKMRRADSGTFIKITGTDHERRQIYLRRRVYGYFRD